MKRLSERGVAGAGIFALTVAVLAMILIKPQLADNDLFKMLAQAIVVQGLVGLSMAYWFTASKDRRDDFTDDNPMPTKVVNPPGDPVPVVPDVPDGEG